MQIPRYIITLHELLAHTPHDHVERKSLQNARQKLEDLSRQMHDEVILLHSFPYSWTVYASIKIQFILDIHHRSYFYFLY